jgi:hypothetical protein
MLPEFKKLKSVNWSSDLDSENDSGRLKNKSNSSALNEESINFSSSYSLKQASDIENGANLTSKPNEIEKISTNDSTLLIVFDTTNRPSPNAMLVNNNAFNSITNMSMANPKVKRTKLNKFLKASNFFEDKQLLFNKYSNDDDFETVVKANNDSDNNVDFEDDDDNDDNESVDSLNFANVLYEKSYNGNKKSLSGGGAGGGSDGKMSKQKKLNSIFNDSTKEYDSEDNVDDETEDEEKEWLPIKKATLKQKAKETPGKKSSLNFQVMLKRKESSSNSNYDEDMNENHDDNNENDDNDATDEDDDEDDEEDDESNSSSDDNKTLDSDELDETEQNIEEWNFSDQEWYSSNYGAGGGESHAVGANQDSDDEKYRKSSCRLHQIQVLLDSVDKTPYLAINNQKMLKWKFNRRDDDLVTDTCSFKIYSTFSKNFESAYYLLDELIDQLNLTKYTGLNDLWMCLVKIGCVQSFCKRLKVFSLLIKIMHKIDLNNGAKFCINLHALKPLKNLQYYLQNSTSYNNSRNLCRALFELFFFAEKLAIKWNLQREYRAHMRDKDEFVEQICETSYFLKLIMNSLNLNGETASTCDEKTAKKADTNSKSKKIDKKNYTFKEKDGESPSLAPNESNSATVTNVILDTTKATTIRFDLPFTFDSHSAEYNINNNSDNGSRDDDDDEDDNDSDFFYEKGQKQSSR